jgi:hypothetical protein
MDEQTIGQSVNAIMQRRLAAIENVCRLAKMLEPLLRDLGHNNSADRLQAALSEVESADAELHALVTKDLQATLSYLTGPIEMP